MRKFLITMLMVMAFIPCIYAAETVYLDGTGATDGAYTALYDAVAALENGGTVIVTGDTAIGTAQSGVTLPSVGGKVTIIGESDVTLTFARSLTLSNELEIDNVTIHSTATISGNILSRGNTLTIGENVIVTAENGALYPAIFGGAGSGTVNYDSHLIVKSGTWRSIYGGNYNGTFNGDSIVEISNLISNGTVSARNYLGTFNGSSMLIADLRGDKTVTAGTYKENPTLVVDDGYEGILMAKTYMQRKIITAEPRIVYVDGTGKTDGAYTSLLSAVSEMPGGGTVIISGNTVISEDTVLPATEKLYITSKYGDEDYTGVASLQFEADLTIGTDTTFKDIILERTLCKGGNLFIIAAGNPLTVDTGVVCINYTGKQYLSIIGGNYNTDYTGDSHITVKSGFFRNVFGGNHYGTFTGNSYVEILGGSYDNAVVGGNFTDNFIGDSHLTFAGNASMLYTTYAQGIIGGTLGDGVGKDCTFTGNIYITLGGMCGINHNVIGASRNKNAFTKGNIEITIEGNAYSFYSIYAGGYYNGVDGSTKVIVNGGDMNGSLFGGSFSGTVTGDTYIEINGGKLCYYMVNMFSSFSSVAGTKNVFGGGAEGSIVEGTSTIRLNGGSVYGDVYGGEYDGVSTVNGTSTVEITNCTIFGKIKADEANIDLSAAGTVSIGVSSNINKLIGGGKLVLAPASKLTVDTISGITEVSINGTPLPVDYISAATVEKDAELTYISQENEALVCSDNTYSIDFDGACPTTVVTVVHKDGFSVRPRAGKATSGDWIAADSKTETTATFTLTPGLYTVTVVSDTNGKNYKRKALYIDGRSNTYTLNVEFDKLNDEGYDYRTASFHTDEMLEKYYKETDLQGYYQPDTPYFNKRYGTSSVYTTNEEITEFLNDKKAACAYMYVYSVATSPYGYDVPLVLFTMDEIPDGATLAEAAAIVGKTKGRDIMMINGGTHGNEPTGTEGTLAFISELCGDYGRTVLCGTNVGAVIVLPRMNPDGFKDWMRETPNPTLVDNLNRDYMALSSSEVSGIVKAYNLFMPTFVLDCHEALANPLWSEGQIQTDIYDAGIKAQCNLNGYGNPLSVIYGDRAAAMIDAETIAMRAIDDLREQGLRTYYYETGTGVVWNTNFFGICGSYAYLLEIPGITGGESFMARRTYSQLCGIKALVNVVLEMNGEMARNVEAARSEVSLSAQIYDGKKAIILESAASRTENRRFEWNNPLVGADTTVRVSDNLTYMYDYDTAIKYRKLPTAYVFPADVEALDEVLSLLDRHDIQYKKLDSGTTLALQSYSGTKAGATLNPVADVTFENGAYLVPVDGARAYITALLFEPDVIDSEGFYCSFAQIGTLAVTDIYRTTESFIAAKLGIDGTYKSIDIPADKMLASATVDGILYDSVAVEGNTAFVVAPKAAEYAVTLSFTDGTTKTYHIGSIGDFNGDGELTLLDALMLLRSILNGSPLDGDVNADGKVGLADVLLLLKKAAA